MKITKYSLVLSLILLSGCTKTVDDMSFTSVFNWDKLENEQVSQSMISFFHELQINALFQGYYQPANLTKRDSMLETLNEANIDLYYVIGDPDYAYTDNCSKLMGEIQNIISEIENCNNGEVVKGIILDIEPYLLDEWEDKKNMIMDQYLKNLRIVYQSIETADLKLILCIPYYFDDMGLSSYLEELVADACDGLAIMNYYRNNEAKRISYEVSLCRKYDKQCINIYEFLEPGRHELEDINTYYHQGIEAAKDSFNSLQQEFGNELGLSFHDYKTVRRLLANE